MGSLGIAIDGGRYVRVDSSISDFPRTVKLRTLQPGQDKAELVFCTFRKKGPLVRRTVLLSGLSVNKDAPSELILRVQRERFALWVIDVRKPDGSREEFRVRTGIGLWIYILPVFLLLVLMLLFLMPMFIRAGLSSAAVSTSVTNSSAVSEHKRELPAAEISPDASEGTDQQADEDRPPDLASEGVRQPSDDVPQAVLPAVTTVFFQPESAVLSSTARAELRKFAELVPENISLDIGGHCADYGTEKGRRILSQNRAQAVSSYLSHRIPDSVRITIHSWGSSRPLSSDPALQDKNRRVEITVKDGSE